jgi:hypothetical protein
MFQRLYHRNYRAVFSANERGEIWTYTHRGYTPVAQRELIHGESKIVDSIAAVFLRDRPEGGRVLINDIAAYYHPERSEPIQFAWLAPKD